MSKKKKKEKKSISILKEVDKTLDHTYDDLKEEIENMQIRLNMADNEARKKAKKAMKKNKNMKPYEVEAIKRDARKAVLHDMEQTSFLDRVAAVLNDIAPIIVVIARLVASLICAILSMDVVKTSIDPDTLGKFDFVYKKAMAIS